MMKTRIDDTFLTMSAVLIVLIAGLHSTALTLFLYWRFAWLDIVMHFLGGFWLSISLLWVLRQIKKEEVSAQQLSTILFVLIGTMIAGVSWEVFEFFSSVPREQNYAGDTTIDLVMDLAGGVAALLFARYSMHKQTVHGTR